MTANGSRKALVLGGEHEEDEEDAQREDVKAGVAGDDLLEGELGPIEDHALGQVVGGELLHQGLGLAGAEARGWRAVDVGGGIAVVAHDVIGAVGLLDVHERAELDEVAGLVAGLEAQDVLGHAGGNPRRPGR